MYLKLNGILVVLSKNRLTFTSLRTKFGRFVMIDLQTHQKTSYSYHAADMFGLRFRQSLWFRDVLSN